MALLKVRPGDVIVRDGERLAVLSVAHRGPNRMRVHAIGTKGRSVSIDAKDFTEPPDRVGEVAMPVAVQPEQPVLPAGGGAPAPEAAGGSVGGRGRRRPATRPRPRRTTRWPAARTGPAHVRAAGQVERLERELADLDRPDRLERRLGGPPVRRGARGARGVGLRAGLVAHRPGRAARPHLPRERPAARRGGRPRPVRRPRPAGGRRARVVLHLRAPQPHPAAAAVVPVGRRAGPVRAARADRPRPAGGRAEGRAARDPAARPDLRRPGPRLGVGHRPGHGARRRGALGRRLRPQHPAAHRPAAPDGRLPPPRGDAGGRRRGGRRLFRGVVAASSLIGTGVDDDEPIGPDDVPED